MALRPTELQIILSATRDIEKTQQIQQQHPRAQQESLALQFQQEIEQRKRQTQSTTKAEQAELKKVHIDDKDQAGSGRKQKMSKKTQVQERRDDTDSGTASDHIIDLLV